MSKKRKAFRKPNAKRYRHKVNKSRNHLTSLIVENTVLKIVYSSPGAITSSEIYKQLLPENHSKKEIRAIIDKLLSAGLIAKSGKNRFTTSENSPIYSGILTQHPRGFGFVEVTNSGLPSSLLRDPFISRAHMGGAVHGDIVLIRILRVRKDNRPEGTVIDIVEQGSDTLCGLVRISGKEIRVFPDDIRFPFTVQINSSETGVSDGDVVKIKYNREATHRKILLGEIIEVLGKQDDITTQMRLVTEKYNLPCCFSEEALKEADNRAKTAHTANRRKDLRSVNHITIDGETAKDFDDAVCVDKTARGFRLYVSIADVSHFVRSGSTLDREAFERGTSVYFPGNVIPMLPEVLSNNLCSLVPGQDRFAITITLDFDKTGKITSKKFYRSLITSKHRFTYTTVKKIVIDRNEHACIRYDKFVQQLQWAKELAEILRMRRLERGSIDFDLHEVEISLTAEGKVKEIKKAERNFAHRMIEEFMLSANEAVASFLADRIKSPLFRVHDKPDEKKLDDFIPFLNKLGLNLPPFELSPSWFATVLQKVKKSRYEYIINNLLLRSLTQASYAITDIGHFGLASSAYTHFTSPIRRYPDLIIHRQLIEVIDAGKESNIAPATISVASNVLSKREQTAVEAERDMHDRLKTAYMKDKIGQSFQAIISGITENSLFIEIEDLCISGGVPLELLDDDYYIYDSKNFRLFGEITAKTYQIGDMVEVELLEVDLASRRLTFNIIN